MPELHALRPGDARWSAWLDRVPGCDFYDLPAYHALAERRGEGEAMLLAWQEGGAVALLPLILRPVAAVPGLEEAGAGLLDATSVYGYSGPLVSGGAGEAALAGFREALAAFARETSIVSFFSRLHPLRDSGPAIHGLGEVVEHGFTVSIDLTLSAEDQWRGFRSNHRRNIKKLRQAGYSCSIGRDEAALSAFKALYIETMERRQAEDSYFFDDDYFRTLLGMGCFEIFLCHQQGSVAAGALVSHCNGIAQYHLGGTVAEHLQVAPMKLVFDDARLWAADHGCTVLHLGGGVGARDDALFNFKAGFSDRRHAFGTWRWLVDEEKAQALEDARSAWAAAQGRILAAGESFPSYRRAVSSIE